MGKAGLELPTAPLASLVPGLQGLGFWPPLDPLRQKVIQPGNFLTVPLLFFSFLYTFAFVSLLLSFISFSPPLPASPLASLIVPSLCSSPSALSPTRETRHPCFCLSQCGLFHLTQWPRVLGVPLHSLTVHTNEQVCRPCHYFITQNLPCLPHLLPPSKVGHAPD